MHPNFELIRKQLSEGKTLTVQFLSEIEELECYPEKDMKAEIIECRKYGFNEDVIVIRFNYDPFYCSNSALESRSYYDKEGVARLTATEAGYYEPQDDIYFDLDSDPFGYFTILEGR